MGFHKDSQSVGVGFCDECYIRIFADETQVVMDGKLICEDCVEEMDE